MASDAMIGRPSARARPPAVSVGLPVYNGAEQLERALHTLLSQRFRDFELIVSDNASTDRTPSICEAYAARDARVRYVRGTVNRGASWNFNHVLQLAEGELFVWAGHDDEWHPDFLERCVGVLRQDPDVVGCYSRYQPVDDAGVAHGDPAGVGCEGSSRRARWNHVLRHWPVHASIYGVMRTAAMRRTRGLLPYLSGDLVFIAELILHGQLIVLPEVLHRKTMPRADWYESSEKVMFNLSGRRSRPWRIRRYGVLREMLVGLRHAGLPPDEERLLADDARWHYLASRSWQYDAMDFVKVLLGVKRQVLGGFFGYGTRTPRSTS
jgi:glycosyltransferase involved in cell wall biosynthesis